MRKGAQVELEVGEPKATPDLERTSTELSGFGVGFYRWLSNAAPLLGYLVAIVTALAVTVGILYILGAAPTRVVSTVIESSFGSMLGFSLVMDKFVPLLLGSAGVAFAMRAGYVNIGVDGQMYAGAVFGVGVAFLLRDAPASVLLPAMLIAAVVGGGLFALIAAALKQKWGINEIFTTVMLNFVGFYLADWLATGPWTDPIAGEAVTKPIPSAALLPRLPGGMPIGALIAVPIALGLVWWLYGTRHGFSVRSVGLNARAARFAGVDIARVTLITLGVSGMTAGLAGAIEVAGVHGRMPSGLSPNYGYVAVLISVLSRRNPGFAIIASLVFAMLIVGGDSLQSEVGLPASAVLMFQALIVLSVLYVDARRGRLWFAQVALRGLRR